MLMHLSPCVHPCASLRRSHASYVIHASTRASPRRWCPRLPVARAHLRLAAQLALACRHSLTLGGGQPGFPGSRAAVGGQWVRTTRTHSRACRLSRPCPSYAHIRLPHHRALRALLRPRGRGGSFSRSQSAYRSPTVCVAPQHLPAPPPRRRVGAWWDHADPRDTAPRRRGAAHCRCHAIGSGGMGAHQRSSRIGSGPRPIGRSSIFYRASMGGVPRAGGSRHHLPRRQERWYSRLCGASRRLSEGTRRRHFAHCASQACPRRRYLCLAVGRSVDMHAGARGCESCRGYMH